MVGIFTQPILVGHPLCPCVGTAGEVDASDVRLQCFVNREQLQDGHTSQMGFSIPELIVEWNLGMTVRTGQLLLTGTPSGVGNAHDPQLFLTADDEVVVRGVGLGELANRLVAVSPPSPGVGVGR